MMYYGTEEDITPLFNGKKIAIVANASVDKDYSEEIDSADIVVRFNHFYNYDSGLVGKKLDYVVALPTDHWKNKLTPEERHEKLIDELKPTILVHKFWERTTWPLFRQVYKNCKVILIKDFPKNDYNYLTTGCAFLYWALQNFKNCEIAIYGYSTDQDFTKYIIKYGKHFLPYYREELDIRAEILEDYFHGKKFLL